MSSITHRQIDLLDRQVREEGDMDSLDILVNALKAHEDRAERQTEVVRESPYGHNVVRVDVSPTQTVWLATDQYRGWFSDNEVADWPII